ncbi:GSCFA domain-containing protein [Croceibacterium ferulae]|uniref:GSCFA domain-containing protein n=1 Tax=Croceibacterium ferulae TaxID=1854641 RepID=UPI000EB07D60|nr:GSCFA domain-containing protein [Croceibacterium ferulae]
MHPPVPRHPYSDLQTYQFWRRSVSAVEAHLVDPVTRPRFAVTTEARVATAGSCFAQHISRRISRSGYRYLVTEDGSDLPEEERAAAGYGLFPARFGNIYTTVQLLQLFEEAFGEREGPPDAWQRPDGRYVDPLRQQVDPRGFASAECVLQDRARHLRCVRRMFEQADVFIFTLGLTEAWRSRADGTVFSSAPGVVGGAFDPERHEFVNFTLEETYAALREFLTRFHAVNPAAKVLLTVSPVPLMATYEDRSVLLSNAYSKSVLRIAADMAIREHDWVDYFPSYEIITGSFAGGLYYGPDHREVNALGVAHAMRCFMHNYTAEGGSGAVPPVSLFDDHQASRSVICDEDVLDAARG